MESEARQDEDTASVRAAVVGWGIGLLLCAIVAGGKIWQDGAYQKRLAQWEEGKTERAMVMQQIAKDMAACRGQVRAVIEEKLARFRPVGPPIKQEFLDLDMQAVSDGEGILINWFFQDGKFIGSSGLRVTPPGPPIGWEEGERARQGIAGFGPMAWVAMIPLVFLVAGWRRGLAQMTFIMALVVGTAWVVQPRSIVWPNAEIATFHGLERTGAWGWVVAMNVVSAGIYAWAVMSRPRKFEPVCPTCKYDLTANVSGVCPECGTRIPMWVKLILRAREGRVEVAEEGEGEESGGGDQEPKEEGEAVDDSPESER